MVLTYRKAKKFAQRLEAAKASGTLPDVIMPNSKKYHDCTREEIDGFIASMDLALRSRSAAMNRAKALGDSAAGSMPNALRRPSAARAFTASLTQPLSVRTRSADIPGGPHIAHQAPTRSA